MSPATPLQRYITGFFFFVFVLVALQSIFPRGGRTVAKAPAAPVPCQGEPIKVDFPYQGSTLDPWTCQVQCTDKKQHYILYSNGQATECETLPGCNDSGEDNGITCTPPKTSGTVGSSLS